MVTPVVDIVIVEVKDDPSPETLNPRLYIREPNNTKGWWCLLHERSARERSPRDHCDQCPSPVLGVPPYSTTDPIGYSRVAAVTALGKELYYSGDNAGPRTVQWKHTGVCNHTAV